MPSARLANRMANTALHTGSATVLDSAPPPTAPRSPPLRRGPVPVGTLRLRAESAPRRGIRWAEDVVDNEGLGRKSSKVCCIYHKPRAVGESSSESSSSDDDDSGSSDSEAEGGAAAAAARKREGEGGGKGRSHKHTEDCAHGKEGGRKGGSGRNAYEKTKTKTRTLKGGGVVAATQVEKRAS
ncbi:hypothetical protein MMC11_008585 [Xylographa trunciseda]|nr:hypothetical protein [Xylographa trunciseda]